MQNENDRGAPKEGALSSPALTYRLYSENSSPFSAPVRVAIYAKGLDFIDIIQPPGGLKSTAYHAINPIGTIPCLIRDDGFILPESAAIMEYLDERFPEDPLLPDEADARARVRLLQRIAELGIMASTVELMQISRLSGPSHASAGPWLTKLVRSLASLRTFLNIDVMTAKHGLTLADCQFGPALFGVRAVVNAFSTGDLIAAYPEIAEYWEACSLRIPVRRVLDEMRAAT